jgi:hypothetical protein
VDARGEGGRGEEGRRIGKLGEGWGGGDRGRWRAYTKRMEAMQNAARGAVIVWLAISDGIV